MKSEETLLWEAVAMVKERELAELYWLLRKDPECRWEKDPEQFKNRRKVINGTNNKLFSRN